MSIVKLVTTPAPIPKILFQHKKSIPDPNTLREFCGKIKLEWKNHLSKQEKLMFFASKIGIWQHLYITIYYKHIVVV